MQNRKEGEAGGRQTFGYHERGNGGVWWKHSRPAAGAGQTQVAEAQAEVEWLTYAGLVCSADGLARWKMRESEVGWTQMQDFS